MKIFAVIVLVGLGYGLALFMRGMIKELALFAIEAWRDVRAEQ